MLPRVFSSPRTTEYSMNRMPTPPSSQISMSSQHSNVFGSPDGRVDSSDALSPAARKKMFDMLKDLGHEVPQKYQQLYNAAHVPAPALDAALQLKATSVPKQVSGIILHIQYSG